MLIPIGTDAPLYRPPWGTASLILLNCIAFLLQDSLIPHSIYALSFGDGYHPTQWIMSAFGHANFCHLLGNMIFLFSFGIIVESMMKLRHYLVLYFSIILVESIATQTLMLGAPGGGCLGASGVIFGLMITACICAPGKNVRWLFGYYHYFTTFEVPVLINGVFYFMWDLGMAGLSDFQVSTPLLHVLGGASGFLVAVVVYGFGWFELDGEDLFSRALVVIGRKPRISKAHRNRVKAAKAGKPVERVYKYGERKSQIAKLVEHLNANRYGLAKIKLQQIREEHGRFQLSEHQLIRLINLATANEDWDTLFRFMDEYNRTFETHRDLIQFNRARILTNVMHNYRQAMVVLNNMPSVDIDPKLKLKKEQLRAALRKKIKQRSLRTVD